MSRDIPLNHITADPEQPRKHFDQAALDELAQSMDANGLAVPILVRPVGERFMLVHGERRWRAATQLGWDTIPAEVRDLSAEEAHWLALIENVQRADLSPIEEARSYQAYLTTGITQEALGQRIGKTQSYIAQKLRLLTLPAPIRLYLDRRSLSEGHARQLLRFKNFYGEDIATPIPKECIDAFRRNDEPGPEKRIALLLCGLRPQAHPIYAVVPKADHDLRLFSDACLAFFSDVEAQNYRVPQWAVAAFWYASMAVHLQVSVVDLKTKLDQWEELFYSAIVECGLDIGKQSEKPLAERSELYWGYREDLKHMRLLDVAISERLPPALKRRALTHILNVGSTALPTAFQAYGPKAEKAAYLPHPSE